MGRKVLATVVGLGLAGAVAVPGVAGAATANTTPSATTTAAEDWFVDVGPGTAFRNEINWLAEVGITTGYPDGTFRPFNPINRDAMAAFLYRFADRPAFTPPATSPFRDVPKTHQFYKEITWLAAEGISTGYPDRTFRPGNQVSREAMAAFLYRFDGEIPWNGPATSPFSDVPTTHQFYREITWLRTTGITTGYPDGTYRPGANVARNAMAAFLYRYANPADVTAPGAVTGLAATATTPTSVTLSWTNPTAPDFAIVLVQRAAGTTPPASPDKGTNVEMASFTDTTATDTGLTPGATYSYSVFTLDTNYNASRATITVTTPAA